MESLEMFLGTKTKCREFAKSALSEVAIDIMVHKSNTHVVIHDYYTAFLVVETLSRSMNNIVREGQELTDLLTKYFIDIFDTKVKLIKSDNGQNEYTDFIIKFCNQNKIQHYFPPNEVMPGISKITIQAVKNLLEECGNDLIEVQIALGAFRDTGTKTTRSPSHLIFCDNEEKFLWDPKKYNKKNLEFSYAQISLMKSKLDQDVLAFSSALRKKNGNSCNFQVDYPVLAPTKIETLNTQVTQEFQKSFMELLTIFGNSKFNSTKTTTISNSTELKVPSEGTHRERPNITIVPNSTLIDTPASNINNDRIFIACPLAGAGV